ncbi:MAG: M42 family peptidase, partial [Nitrospinota bacterium]
MEKASLDFLRNLLNTISPSGYEEEAARVWTEWTGAFADTIEKDNHGNIMAGINPQGTPRVMLAGHIDEIGFMVTYIDEKGFLSFAPIGGHDIQIVQGMRVEVKTEQGRIRGLIGKKPIHLLDPDDRKKVPKYEDLWIDIGARDGEEARSLVKTGDPVVSAYNFEELRNGLAVARAFDDKIGAFVVAEALRLLAADRPQAAVFAVATVQEEIGLRGARTSAYRLNPDIGIAIDVTFATDHPGMEGKEKKRFGEIRLGGGPVLARGPN